jgi:quinol monooxygenase YgiN
MEEVVLMATFRAFEGREAELEQWLADAVVDAHANDPGVIRFVLHRVVDDPRTFVVYEWFRSHEALADRKQRPATAAMRTALMELRESSSEQLLTPVPSKDGSTLGER